MCYYIIARHHNSHRCKLLSLNFFSADGMALSKRFKRMIARPD